MRVSGFHHVAIQVRDVERCAAFYCERLGLTEQARHHREDGSLRSIWVALPEGGFLAIEAASSVRGEPGRATPADTFRTDRLGVHLVALRIARSDRAAIEDMLVDRGVEIVHRTRWTLYIRDPEGNRIGLSHHPND